MEKKVLFTASTASHIRNFHLPYLRAFCEHGWTVHVACGGPEAVIPDAHEVKILPFRKKMLGDVFTIEPLFLALPAQSLYNIRVVPKNVI